MLDLAFGPYTVSEARLFTLLISRLPSAMLVVGDTTACSFTIFAMALQRGSHLLCPLCPGRKRQVLRRLSRNDTLELWPRSTPAHVIYPQFLRELPAAIEVRVIERSIRRRGYRDYKVTLVTTLLDAKEFPANDLVQQYLQRWDIELDIRTLKHQHGLEILSGLTPQVACREMYAAILAYNCVRALMAQASATPRRLSHHRSIEILLHISAQMVCAATIRLPELFAALLHFIRTARSPQQDRPPEPRAILHRKHAFPYLTSSCCRFIPTTISHSVVARLEKTAVGFLTAQA